LEQPEEHGISKASHPKGRAMLSCLARLGTTSQVGWTQLAAAAVSQLELGSEGVGFSTTSFFRKELSVSGVSSANLFM